ncbi:MAG: hypothetical protein ACKODS_06405, partial [Methylophilaceae bacterium]
EYYVGCLERCFIGETAQLIKQSLNLCPSVNSIVKYQLSKGYLSKLSLLRLGEESLKIYLYV